MNTALGMLFFMFSLLFCTTTSHQKKATDNFLLSNEANLLSQYDPPLTPSSGGKSIDGRSLQVGDIIFSTTNKPLSWLIRTFTGNGPVSHVAIVSDKMNDDLVFVVEAIGTGVRKILLGTFLNENTFAAAFRYSNTSSGQLGAIAKYLNDRIGAQYDSFGALTAVSPVFRFGGRKVEVDYGQFKSEKTYCSKLMLEAYQTANIDLTQVSGDWSPNALVTLTWTDILSYVGHLKYTP